MSDDGARIASVGAGLGRLPGAFLFCCGYTQTFDHLGIYCRGLLSDLPRKTRRAHRPGRRHRRPHPAGVPQGPRLGLRRTSATRCNATSAGRPARPARRRPGHRRPRSTRPAPSRRAPRPPACSGSTCGCVGKIDNGIVTVHLGVCPRPLQDPARRRPVPARVAGTTTATAAGQAGIPDDVRLPPQVADRPGAARPAPRATACSLDWLTFDEGYGKAPASCWAWTSGSCASSARCRDRSPAWRRTAAAGDPTGGSRAGPPRTWCGTASAVPRPAVAGAAAGAADAGGPGVAGQGGAGVAVERGGWSAGTYWLIWASNDATGEEKYFLSNAPADDAGGDAGAGGVPPLERGARLPAWARGVGLHATSRGGTTWR